MHNFSTLFLTAFLIILTGCSRVESVPEHTLPAQCGIYDMKQAACIGQDALLERLAPYRVLFVGDHHASERMHVRLAELLDGLSADGRQILLASEWFTPGDDPVLAAYADGTFEGNFTAAVDWKQKAGYPFASYESIYLGVREGHGRMFGINMEKSFQKALSDQNLSALSQTQRAFYDGLDMNLTAHRALLVPFFSRCHAKRAGESEAECLERMYRVQVAWDSYMGEQSARLASERLRSSRDLLVVFAGAMHLAYGVGINARFARLCAEPFVTLLPVPEGTAVADVGEADFLLFYPQDIQKEHP